MKKIFIIPIVLVLGFCLIYFAYLADNDFDINPFGYEEASLAVSSEGPIPLSLITSQIIMDDCFECCDNETLLWMESLGDKYVFISPDEYVVMNKADANKIPSQYATDVSITEYFNCKIIDKRSLGNDENMKNVLYVYDVKYTGEHVHYFDV
ncbi:MAG: hypothetical protein BZ138_05570 [Methanosphaera sp. rholeuAM270]|nr:MAG: hypothetical protein BZ138_05570 [Methanosphaera sp. rholeuAM270]